MKKHNDFYIIGIDHGYGNIKTANTVTPTGVVASASPPMFAGDTLVYGGTYYRVGEGHKDFYQSKTEDEDYYILTLAAIAKELAAEQITDASVYLAVGLPMKWVARQKDSFKAYLIKNREVTFTYNGTEYHVTFVGCSVYPQGYPALLDRLDDLKGDVLLADIGNGTMNILFLTNGTAHADKAWTTKLGVEQCVIAAKAAVMDDFGVVVPDNAVEQILRTGKADIGKKYVDTIRKAASQYVSTIFHTLCRHEYNPDLMRLIIVGGGGCLVKHFGKVPGRCLFVDDICASAKGYERLAEMKLNCEVIHEQ